MVRNNYYPSLTDFEKLIKIAGIPEFNIYEYFKMLKIRYTGIVDIESKNVGNRQISSKENVNKDI